MVLSGVYSIVCKDTNIQELYIGSTEDFDVRLGKHKSDCNNKNSKEYNKNVYQFIRENGGWDNWKFIWLELFKTDDTIFLRQLEQHYMDTFPQELLLNSKRAYRSEEEKIEQKKQNSKKYHEKHKEIILEKKKQKVPCPKCFKSISNRNIHRHLKTYCKKNN